MRPVLQPVAGRAHEARCPAGIGFGVAPPGNAWTRPMRREPLPAPWTEKRRPAVLARALPPGSTGEGNLTRPGPGLGVVHAVAFVNRIDCRKPASGTSRACASGCGRGCPAVKRRVGSRCAALFDERSGGGGPGSREGRPQGRLAAGATERARGRPTRLSDGRKRRPGGTSLEAPLTRGTVPSGARSSLRRGLRARACRSGRSAVKRLFTPPSREEIERNPRVLVVQVGLQRSVRRIDPANAEGDRKVSRGDVG